MLLVAIYKYDFFFLKAELNVLDKMRAYILV